MNVEYAGAIGSPPTFDNAALKTVPDRLPGPAQQLNLYAAAFQHLPSPALIVGHAHLIVACNTAASALFDLLPAAVIGREWWRLIRLTDQTPHPRSGVQAPAERTHACVVRVSTGDRPAQVRAVPLDGVEASTAQLLMIDLSDGQSTDGADARGSFLLDVAHELRSPLQSFNMALAGLAEGGATLSEEGHRRLVGAAQRSAIHLQTLVENLLDAASLGANQFGVRATATDMADVMGEAALVVDPLLRLNEQSIVIDAPVDLPLVLGDGQRLRQVLVNLLHNAVKYGPHRQPIALRACSLGTVVLVQVTDRGAGIPAAEQPRLFERRFRGNSARGAGNGLGLGISRAIVEQHGGHIGVRSAPGYGATFWFTLPAA